LLTWFGFIAVHASCYMLMTKIIKVLVACIALFIWHTYSPKLPKTIKTKARVFFI